MMRGIILRIDTRKERRALNGKHTRGTNDVEQGSDPKLQDFMRIAKEAWDNIPSMKLARRWVNADILPASTSAEILSVYGRMPNTKNQADTAEVVAMLKNLSINLRVRDPLHSYVLEDVYDDDIERWMEVENDDEIQDSMVSDAMNTLINVALCNGEIDCNNEEETDIKIVPQELPTLPTVFTSFHPLQQMAISSNLPDAISDVQWVCFNVPL